MKTLTMFIAWLIGYYYERCPVCGRGVAYLPSGRLFFMCSRRKHREDDARWNTSAPRKGR